MRLRALLVLALLCTAGPAHALSALLRFEGSVAFTIGSAPSLAALGLGSGSPLHYEVRVDTEGPGFFRTNTQTVLRYDFWNAPDDHTDSFFAELVAQAYPTPGSYYGWGREWFEGADITSFAFSCAPVGRLSVGPEMFLIDGCGAIESWEVGKEVGSWHVWHDPDTGESSSVFGDLILVDIVPVPEPGATAMLASGATLLACLHRRRLLRS
jgi:hypothetical protein